jgi:predicted phosphodiesterase
MKLLVFSDLHSDFRIASKLVELSDDVDVVVCAGDLCNVRRGLEEIHITCQRTANIVMSSNCGTSAAKVFTL